MRINHNIAALNTHRQLNSASGAQAKSMEKLSSGLRINKAGDDAAGLAISEKMRGQIRGLDMASRNAQDAISLTQTAEGALNETHDILQRMRELAVQASNDTNTGDDRKEIQKEINQLSSEVNRIGNTTEFNTQKLLNGDFEKTAAVTANVQGTSVGSSITINGVATSGEATGAALTTLEIHSGKGESVTFSTTFTAGNDNGPNVTAANNEFTFTLNGEQQTIVLDEVNYGSGADDGPAEFAANIESKIQALGTVNGVDFSGVTASLGADGKISIATANATDTISVDGGNALTHLGTSTVNPKVAANNTMDITLDGITKTITLADNNYDGSGGNTLTDLAADIQSQVDTVFGSGKLTVTKTVDDKLNFESQSTGSNSKVSFSGAMVSTLGLSNPTTTNGTDDDTTFKITVDGENVDVDLSSLVGSNDSNVFAAQLQNSINAATGTAADVKVSFENGKLNIQSGTEGSGGSVSITDNGAAKSLGLSTSNGAQAAAGADEANAELKFQIGANQGQSMSVVIGDMRSESLGITATTDNTTTTLKDSSGKDVTVHFTKGTDNAVTNGTNNTGVEFALDVSTSDKASAAVLAFDKAIASVSSERSRLGSYQNRLEHTINNLNTSSENLTAAESRVRDVDYALAA